MLVVTCVGMCELFCLSARLPTRATLSLRAFAARGGRGATTVDGWGLALQDGRDVRLYKEPEPAADSTWLDFIQTRRLATQTLISHIRHATHGGICLANTEPFVRELGGRMHVFAHNGRLDGIELPASGCWRPVGETDSEAAFCRLLEVIAPAWQGAVPPTLKCRLELVSRFAASMRRLGPANFLYSDGEFVFAHGHRRIQADGTIAPPGLWRLERACELDRDALVAAGISVEPPAAGQQLTLVASVPLSDEDWRPLAEGEVVVVGKGQVLHPAPC